MIIRSSIIGTILTGSLVTPPISAMAITLHVPSQYATINNALDAASQGDTVLVAPGIYTEAEERVVDPVGIPYPLMSLAFLKDGVTLRSQGGSQVTVLDLNGQASSWGYGFIAIAANLTATTEIEGFAITGAPIGNMGVFVHGCTLIRWEDCVFHDLDSRGFLQTGGAVLATESGVEFVNCIFRDCAALVGGGILYQSGPLLSVLECQFDRCLNSAIRVWDDFSFFESVTIRNSAFHENTNEPANASPVAITDVWNLLVEGCIFADNVGHNVASDLSIARTKFTIRSNLFLRSYTSGSPTNAGSVTVGGPAPGPVTLEGNTFFDCRKEPGVFDGAAVFINSSEFPQYVVERNVFASCEGAEAIYVYSGNVDTSCNVFWQNVDGNSNIPLDSTDRDIDPEFCDPQMDNFTVHSSSPCLPPNSPGCGLIGAFDQGCGTISVEDMSWGRIKNLYRVSNELEEQP